MGRETELFEQIRVLQSELDVIRDQKMVLRNIDDLFKEAKIAGVREDEILGILDIIYHPERYDLTDQD